ncbi:hypothetical protein PHYPSEUDO_010316 [Phytophthora pseudosyringae]|uniref:Uncharacterized protein n=1 Tax=Phytophthora pseudosyringae TaxID=221518 RepID=A0A8T1VAD8_9STRA|nr:hypothetical protein PHYPSEUDO_010316 [Phytophthora pseudosyringae]
MARTLTQFPATGRREMERAATLGRAFREVAHALASSHQDAVGPATAAGFVAEVQVLTEMEWQRLVRVGLRLAPGADVRGLYCFRNVPAFDGLTVRVLRLVQESPTGKDDGRREVWKVQKTPVVRRRRAESDETGDSTVGDTPPRAGNRAKAETLSPTEVQRKRRRTDDTAGLVAGSKCTVDEVRPPSKTRRLSGHRKERSAAVVPLSLPARHVIATSAEGFQQPEQVATNGTDTTHAGLIAVVEGGSSSSESINEDADEDNNTASDTSNSVQSDEDIVEEESARTTCTGRWDRSEGATSLSAAMRIDDDAGANSRSHARPPIVNESTSTTLSLKPLWSALQSATTRAHKLLNKICAVEVDTAQDSLNYDLRWVQENGKQRWTMFGEPSSPGTTSVQHERRRTTKHTWKF